MHALLREPKNNLPEVVQIAGQAGHRLADHRIALANVFGKLFELRAMKVFAGGLVCEPLVEGDALKLTQLFLVKRADAEVSDELTGSAPPFRHVSF
jgi:hypothetical protein